MDWLERCDWSRRTAEFGELSLHGEDAHMEFLARVPPRLWELWGALHSQHPNRLIVAGPGRLRYAALDWTHTPVAFEDDGRVAERVATWGIVLARLYEELIDQLGIDQLAWFCTPLVTVDLEGQLRVGFVAADDRVPPELMDQWPIGSPRALVHVVGQALRALTIAPRGQTHLGAIIQRCVERDPARRFKSLDELRVALQLVGGRMVRTGRLAPRRAEWLLTEEGIGLLAVDQPTLALERFERVLRNNRTAPVRSLVDEARRRGANTVSTAIAPTAWPPIVDTRTAIAWSEALPMARELEQKRDFPGALAIYRRVVIDDATDVEALELAAARCYFELRVFTSVTHVARRILARDPHNCDALALATNALLREKHHADALPLADTWIAIAPDDGRAHYARGKCLVGLRRLHEARAEFERACVLTPALVEAMWLRAAVDRSLGNLKASVGVPVPTAMDLPPGALRDAVAEDRIADAIDLLLARERAVPLQLLLGHLLLRAGRTEEALAVFER